MEGSIRISFYKFIFIGLKMIRKDNFLSPDLKGLSSKTILLTPMINKANNFSIIHIFTYVCRHFSKKIQ
ncbi:MAG: hypothetical protein EBZ47_07950 [Chlamydiae bacterium]|nr:hypothetical protein [Chlamydiota bacterium]